MCKKNFIPESNALEYTHRHDYLNAYVNDLSKVLDMEAIHNARVNIVVDPLGDTVVHYWTRITDRYGLYLAVVNEIVDPTFIVTLSANNQSGQ